LPYPIAPPFPQLPEPDLAPFVFSGDRMSDELALSICWQSFTRMQQWRSQNCDARWQHNEWLYYGRVAPRYWKGTTVQRASVPVEKAFPAVDAAHAAICNELFGHDEMFDIMPVGDTTAAQARKQSERLVEMLDANVDDYGWTARLECQDALKDDLIYGICYGLIEYDHDRQQSVLVRRDPRDVWVDPGATSSYADKARRWIVRNLCSVEEVDSWRGVAGFNIPSRGVLHWMAQNRVRLQADSLKAMQEAARGGAYQPVMDDRLIVDPSQQLINVFVHGSPGREQWTLDNTVMIYNAINPYKCSRLVSAPCYTVPNRHYGKSLVDAGDWIQEVSTSLLNSHLDEVALSLNPPRTAKSGNGIRTPNAGNWYPGLAIDYANPKDDFIAHPPSGITANVWDSLNFLNTEGQKLIGQTDLSMAGMPSASNANRTKGGMSMQLQASNMRLSRIAYNFEQYFLIPAFYKMLKIDNYHRKNRFGVHNGY